MACTPGRHGYVVASGRCSDCGQPVLASGDLSADAAWPGNGWGAASVADPDTAATCPTTGLGHHPDHATGACADCGSSMEALDGLWFSTPTDPYFR